MRKAHTIFIDAMLSQIEPKASELVNIHDSLDRILTSDIKATHPFPAKDTVSANGYAIIGEDTNKAPVNINIVGKATAEKPFEGTIKNGQAVRTFVGSPLPDGADTVICDDECEVKDDHIIIQKQFLQEQNILYEGIDFSIDETMLKKGAKISSINLAIAASMNLTSLQVSMLPHIGLLEISDVNLKAGEGVDPEQTISTTDVILNSFIKSSHATAVELGTVAEDKDLIKDKIESASNVDLIVIVGGTSKSCSGVLKKYLEDHNDGLLEILPLNLSEELSIMFSIVNNTPILSLPSHPISAYITSVLFLKPIIEHLNNQIITNNRVTSATLDRDMDINDQKMDYICSKLILDEDKSLRVNPASSYDRMLLSTLLSSDCLIQTDKENCKKGSSVNIIRLDD